MANRGSNIKTILILEDQPEAYQLLTKVVASVIEKPIISHAASLQELEQFSHIAFDLFLVDLSLPDGLSYNSIKAFKLKYANTPAIVTTLYADDDMVFKALRAGADGYLLKSDGYDRLLFSLNRMLMGEPPISPSIARKLMRQFEVNQTHASNSKEIKGLSPREIEVLALIAQGLMTKQVADQLSLSKHTINDLIKSIYKKLGIRSRSEATLQASRHGLI